MSPSRIVIGAILACAGLAGCGDAPSTADEPAKLKELTATAVAGVDPQSVIVSDVVRKPASISWRAASAGKSYSCNADNAYRLPMCEPDA